MSWIKNVVVDLAVVLVLAVAVVLEVAWARWAILVYTPLMVVLKLMAVAGGATLGKLRKEDAVPAGFYHLLYGASLALAVYGQWWIIAAGWAAIWLLSVVAELRMRPAARPARG